MKLKEDLTLLKQIEKPIFFNTTFGQRVSQLDIILKHAL